MARILVIGPGALGIPTAIRLQHARHDVALAVRSQEKADRLNATGITMTAPDGSKVHANTPAIASPAGQQPFDLIVHTTKCKVAADVLKTWLPALKPDGLVIPFQNGLMADHLAPVAGHRFVECSVYWPATLHKEGHSHMTADGHNIIGPWPTGTPTTQHDEAARILSAVAPTETHADMQAVKWSKLIVNSAMTSLGVVTNDTMRDMMRHKATRQAFIGVLREGLAVMKAQGIKPVTVGSSKPGLLGKLPDAAAHIVLRILARKYGDYRSSSAQSLARGEKTEVDFLNGVIVAAGHQYSIPTPVNAALVQTVHDIEAGSPQGRPIAEALMRQI